MSKAKQTPTRATKRAKAQLQEVMNIVGRHGGSITVYDGVSNDIPKLIVSLERAEKGKKRITLTLGREELEPEIHFEPRNAFVLEIETKSNHIREVNIIKYCNETDDGAFEITSDGRMGLVRDGIKWRTHTSLKELFSEYMGMVDCTFLLEEMVVERSKL